MEKVKITTTEVLELLDLGKTREEIRDYYGLSNPDLKRLFKHPRLKGRKTKKAPGFDLEDDIVEIRTSTFVDAGMGDREPSMERDIPIIGTTVFLGTNGTAVTYPSELDNREEVELVTDVEAEEEVEERIESPEWLK